MFKKKKRYEDLTNEEKEQVLKKLGEENKKHEEEQKIDDERRRKERENFLEGILKGVEGDFNKYEKGYRVTSIKTNDIIYKPDTKTLSDITNRIANKYGCKLNSFSVCENSFSGKTYFFMFEK